VGNQAPAVFQFSAPRTEKKGEGPAWGISCSPKLMNCPVCGSSGAIEFCTAQDRLHGIAGEFRYVTCMRCGTIYQNPRIPNDEIASLYPADYAPWIGAGPASLPWWKRRLRDTLTITGLPAFMRNRLDRGVSLLDVGCGSGKFMVRITVEHPASRVSGIDFSLNAVDGARSLGMDARCATIPEIAAESERWDMITMWWYLEHVPEPEEILQDCNRLLNPEGIIGIGVPNARSLNRMIFRRRWFHLDPPRHLCIFTPASLTEMLNRCGFDVVKVVYDKSPWGILGSLQYCLCGRIEQVESSWLNSRVLKILFRPIAMAVAVLRLSDTIAVYAKKVRDV
jgi:SAM-dependent methyltransferase